MDKVKIAGTSATSKPRTTKKVRKKVYSDAKVLKYDKDIHSYDEAISMYLILAFFFGSSSLFMSLALILFKIMYGNKWGEYYVGGSVVEVGLVTGLVITVCLKELNVSKQENLRKQKAGYIAKKEEELTDAKKTSELL